LQGRNQRDQQQRYADGDGHSSATTVRYRTCLLFVCFSPWPIQKRQARCDRDADARGNNRDDERDGKW
jgi:hypothetical protein